MPRYFVYMSAQGLLLAGKISGIKVLRTPREMNATILFLARNLSNSHYPWRSFDSLRNLKFAVRIKTDKDNTAIIVGVTVAIALLLFLLGIGLFMRRRRSQGRKTTETRATDNLSLPDSVIETRYLEIITLLYFKIFILKKIFLLLLNSRYIS